MLKQFFRITFLFALVCFISACSQSRYHLKHDKGPSGEFDVSQIPPVEPRVEPLSRGGNKSPYQVRGKTYSIMPNPVGYVEEGIGSWYGYKFHGYATSNGETYNMYAFSAAHKSLPLPSYLNVTNLENGKSLVVRVNDRGPFHDDRIIDLSFAAARKLGFDRKGTARLRLEYIDPRPPVTVDGVDKKAAGEAPDKLAKFIQVGSFGQQNSADRLKNQLVEVVKEPVFVAKSDSNAGVIHRVRVGPFFDDQMAEAVKTRLRELGWSNAILITRSLLGRGL